MWQHLKKNSTTQQATSFERCWFAAKVVPGAQLSSEVPICCKICRISTPGPLPQQSGPLPMIYCVLYILDHLHVQYLYVKLTCCGCSSDTRTWSRTTTAGWCCSRWTVWSAPTTSTPTTATATGSRTPTLPHRSGSTHRYVVFNLFLFFYYPVKWRVQMACKKM